MKDIAREIFKMLGNFILFMCMGVTIVGVFAFGSKVPMLFYFLYGACCLVTVVYIAKENIKNRQ